MPLRLPGIAVAVPLFPSPDHQPAKVLSQGIAYQRRAILSGAARGLIGSTQELPIENDLDGHHTMLILLHSILHIHCASLFLY